MREPRTIKAGLELLIRIPKFVNKQFTIDEARHIQTQRLDGRETRFLQFVQKAIYGSPGHPIYQLLKHAGCEFGDLESLVTRNGLEEALRILLHSGVYLTVDEFKGRQPAVRGSSSVSVHPDQLRNPLAAFHVAARTGGSRGVGTPVLIDLAYVRACAVAYALCLHARGGSDWLKVTWETPGAGARFRLLKFSCFGSPPAAWFTQVDPEGIHLDRMFSWSERAMRWGARLGGVRLPRPVLATLDNPRPIVHWIREALNQNKIPHLESFPSSIVRLSTTALESGIDICGTRATIGGEPITHARLATIAEAGVDAAPRYGSIECGPIAYGCQHPETSDDTHVLRDLHAVIQPGSLGECIGLPSRTLLVTNLHPAAPYTMLNVSLGDEGDMADRACGCPLEQLSWNPHLSNVRSYEKLTAGGMTFYDSDLLAVLEQVLPKEFGGNAADYQLVEEENSVGQPIIKLLVHPRLGSKDTDRIQDTFLRAIGKNPIEGMMAAMWRESHVVRVERRPPLSTPSSKILHLHVSRSRQADDR